MKKVLLITLFLLSVMITSAQPVCVVGRTLCTGTSSGGTSTSGYTNIQANGTATAPWPTLNFINGTNMTISCVSNSGQMKTDCTFVASGGGGGSNAFSALTTSTNTSAVMTCGTGCSILPSGAGSITANIFTGTLDLSGSNFINQLPTSKGGTGANALTGIALMNGSSPFTAATSTNILALWSGTCNSGTFLRGDGACITPAGSGTVNSGTGTHLAFYSSTGTAVSDMGTEFTFSSVSHTLTGASNAIIDLHAGTTSGFLLSGSYSSGILEVTTSTGAITSVTAPSGAIVGTTDTQTLTGKSIAGSEINSSVVGSAFGGSGANLSASVGILRAGNPFTASELSGDASTSGSNAVTVAKVNGVSFPASPSTHAVPVVIAANTITWKVVNTCGDATHALSYDQGTDVWGCQAITASATAGGSNTQFQYNNATALGGVADFTFDGTHTIALGASGILDLHAAATSAFKLPGAFASGVLKVTTTTGAVSVGTISTCGDATHAVSYDGTNFGCQAITATATAGGSNGQLQYNNSSALGGTADFSWNGTHTLASGASGILDLHLAATSGLLLPGTLSTGLVTVTTSTGAISSVAAPTGAVVGTTDTQTLTNKSIGGAEINSGTIGATFGGTGADLHLSTGIVRAGNPFSVAELSGDATTAGSNIVTVLKVNGVSFPSAPSLHSVPVVTASNTVTWKVVNTCGDSSHAISYNQSTDTWGCQAITGTAGFGSLGDTFFSGDGTTTTFTPFWGLTGSLLMVFENGVKQRAGVDYTVSGGNIVFVTAPQTGDMVEAIQ